MFIMPVFRFIYSKTCKNNFTRTYLDTLFLTILIVEKELCEVKVTKYLGKTK